MPPTVASRYDIVRPLGRGAFGHTFLARDTREGRDVALKVLDARGAASLKVFELFEREAAVLRSLRHHGIPAVFDSLRDSWEGADSAFLVMEYVEGTSLAEGIEQQRHFEHEEVMHVFLELLGILEYLHGRVPPILHRDIKPSNIIVRADGSVALVDFGSVRRVFLGPDEAGSTVAGTYGYMPYEQYMGQASPSSDLFALAATLLHVVTGRAPKDFMTQEGRVEVPVDLPGDERFRTVIARMLRPSPAERFAGVREVRSALFTLANVPAVAASPGRVVRASAGPALPAAPRTLDGVTRERFDRVAHPWWRFADPHAKVGEEGYSLWSIGLFAVFSVLTVGFLPATFGTIARSRRLRLRRFFERGIAATGEITRMEKENLAFGVHLSRVHYEYEADLRLLRDSDQVLPVIADRWRPGDRIELLYLPDAEYDSVIISTT